jgi:iron-sulfur cluster assembly protein
MAVALTETAVKQVKQLIEAQNLQNVYLRMGVKKFDIDGVQVVCDAKSYLYLNGTTLDYVTQGLTGGFTFVNPQAKSSCGCGTSFSA